MLDRFNGGSLEDIISKLNFVMSRHVHVAGTEYELRLLFSDGPPVVSPTPY